MKNWYEIIGSEAHQGTGRSKEIFLYVFRDDIVQVMSQYQTIPGVKKRYCKIFPGIRKLSPSEANELESVIGAEGETPLSRAKNNFYATQGFVRYTRLHPQTLFGSMEQKNKQLSELLTIYAMDNTYRAGYISSVHK